MEVRAIWARRHGNNLILAFEAADGTWRRAASEYVDGQFSRIVELNRGVCSAEDASQPRPLSDFPVDEP